MGLEVHAQLKTRSKLFCGDSTAFGAEPNTQVSPITLAHPGTLPKMNRLAVTHAIKMGIACHCEIAPYIYFDRKNYFYPDLPKGYQVSQQTTPVCNGGFVRINTSLGEKKVKLNRIHLEEDAGKSIHDLDEEYSCIDYNRAGTALIEIVTEPDIENSEQAFAFLSEIRKLVRYLDICDGNMEEGSLRCDANISVRKTGDSQLGTKVEVKNLNSIRNVKRAIDHEAKRIVELLEKGLPVVQQTRSFDANTGTTFATREKEQADDYRYFPEPDLAPFQISENMVEAIKATIPVLQEHRIQKYVEQYSLSYYDASVLTEEKEFSDYFEAILGFTNNYKAAANWMIGPVRNWLNTEEKEISSFPLSVQQIASLIELIEDGKLSFTAASTKVFSELLRHPSRDAREIAEGLNIFQQSDSGTIEPVIEKVLAMYPDKVIEYKKGKKGLLSLFVGEVMKQSKGKADPKVTNRILLEKLKS